MKKAAVDYNAMPIEQIEKLLNIRQRKFVANLFMPGVSQTEAAAMAGYSPKTAASQATMLLKNPKVSAYRRALAGAIFDSLGLSPAAIALKLHEIYERCMQKEPVMEWDSILHEWVPSGQWKFDSKGATRVLELLGKNVGMFTERVSVSGSIEGLEPYLRGVAGGENKK